MPNNDTDKLIAKDLTLGLLEQKILQPDGYNSQKADVRKATMIEDVCKIYNQILSTITK